MSLNVVICRYFDGIKPAFSFSQKSQVCPNTDLGTWWSETYMEVLLQILKHKLHCKCHSNMQTWTKR